MTEFTVEPVAPALGAEIRGIDCRDPLDAATVERLEAAFHEHVVLVFRGQQLSQQQQIRFAVNFGELGGRKRRPEDRPEGPDSEHIMLITNIRKNGVPIGSLPDGDMLYHHDKSYTESPDKATFLYAIEPTRDGGHTLFANMYKAYDMLRPALRERLAGRQVLQIYQYDPKARVDPGRGVENFDHYYQPAVVAHPVTGRRALYTSQLMTMKIVGVPDEESDAILAELWELNAHPDIVYAHVWRPGDLVMWDNYCSTHARTDFPADQTRLMRRCTVTGQKMIAA